MSFLQLSIQTPDVPAICKGVIMVTAEMFGYNTYICYYDLCLK